jgi:heptosyltransferase III
MIAPFMQSSILGGMEKNNLQPGITARRVLIYRLGSLGDTVVALPCFHLIARKFPQAERVLLTNFPVHAKAPASAAVLGDSGLVHGYMRYTAGTRNVGELLRLAWRIRRFRPDVLIYLMPVRPLNNVRRDRFFFRVAGVRHAVGFPGEPELNHRFDAATGLYESEASRLGRALAELGDVGSEESANWNLGLTDRERQAATAALGTLARSPLIVCGPGTKMQAKDWGQDNWRALLTRLHAEYPRHSLALIGAKEDAGVSEYAAQEWTGPKVNLCGKLTPRETAAVLEYADIFLGPDSGPMHLAASVGVPCVIAFSAAGLPGVWFPAGEQHQIVYHQTSCHGCKLETCVVEARRCLTSITVAEMAEAVAKAMSGQTGSKSAIAVL